MAATWRRRLCAITPRASERRPRFGLATTYNVAENWQNARDGFDNIFQACAAEPACRAAHPHLEQTFTGLVNKLEAEPLTATVKDPATGEDIKVVIDGGALVDWLRNQNYAVPMLQAAPIASMDSPAGPTLSRQLPWIGRVGAATRSGCPCSRLRTVLWRQLSRKLSIRDAGGPRRGWPESVSELSGLDPTRGRRRLGIFQRGLRSLEGPRCPGGHARSPS